MVGCQNAFRCGFWHSASCLYHLLNTVLYLILSAGIFEDEERIRAPNWCLSIAWGAITGLRVVEPQNVKQATGGGVIAIHNDAAPMKNLSALCLTVGFLSVTISQTYLTALSVTRWSLCPGLLSTETIWSNPKSKHCRRKCKYNAHNRAASRSNLNPRKL